MEKALTITSLENLANNGKAYLHNDLRRRRLPSKLLDWPGLGDFQT